MSVQRLVVLCCLCAAVLAAVACSGSDESAVQEPPANETPAAEAQGEAPAESPAEVPASPPASVSPADAAAAEEVAAGFLEAYGAFDVEQAITYLADDADLPGLVSSAGAQSVPDATVDDFRLLVALLEAMGYKQILHPCEQLASSTSGSELRCPFDYQFLRSDEIGLGPYSGSYWDLTVRDGEIVQASKTWGITEFSPQMWDPFARWVATNYPEDVEVMYTGNGGALTEDSIALWEERTREYVEQAGQ
jgi:hypothetical protein